MKYLVKQQLKVIERALVRAHRFLAEVPDTPRKTPSGKELRMRREVALAAGLYEDTTVDPWHELIRVFVIRPVIRPEYASEPLYSTATWPPRIYTNDILQHAIGLPSRDWQHTHKIRIGRILISLGFVRRQESPDKEGYRRGYWTLLTRDAQRQLGVHPADSRHPADSKREMEQ